MDSFQGAYGSQVRFCHDKWCGQSMFLIIFPNLYLLEKRKQAFVAGNLITGGRVVWDFHFYRDMTGEAADFTRMIGNR